MTTAVRGVNPIWWIPDLVGNPLDDTYYMFVLSNEIPYQPVTIWQDEDMSVVRANPIQFLANGALPVDVYYDPGVDDEEVYRLEIRQGDTQSDPLIWLVENWKPGTTGTVTPGTVTNISDNQITNSQFVVVNFETNLSRTVGSGTHSIPVAPDWTLQLEGAGTYTIRRQPLTNSPSTPTGAPYALRITLNGFTSAFMYQRFQQNGVIWANKFVAVNLTGKIDSGNSSTIGWRLVDSMGTPVVTFGSRTLTASYAEYRDVRQLGTSTNTNVPPNAWMDFQISFNGTVDLYITSLQLVTKQDSAEVQYTEDTVNRQLDYTFHYYQPGLLSKPVKNMLVGWNFPLNPTQMEGGISGNLDVYSGSNYNAKYIWDQTIGGRGATGAVAYTRNSITGGLQFTTSGTNDSFWICQYLTGKEAKAMIGQPLSININAFRNLPAPSSTASIYIYLYSGTAAATIPTLSLTTPNISQIFATTISSAGAVSGAGVGWTPIPRDVVDNAVHTINPISSNADISSSVNNIQLTGWNLTETQMNDHDKFAILAVVVYSNSGSVITLNSINLCPGNIPGLPAPMSADEELRRCQYYYSKTYEPETPAGTITAVGAKSAQMRQGNIGTVSDYYNANFSLEYPKKRANPNIYFYSPGSATLGLVRGVITEAGSIVAFQDLVFSNNWTGYGASTTGINYFTTNTGLLPVFTAPASGDHGDATLTYQVAVDARLGLV